MAKNKRRKPGPGKGPPPKKSPAGALKSEVPSKPATRPPPTIPFHPLEDRILLVGEGDFSFAQSLVAEHHCVDVTATCLDSQTDLFAKYIPQAEENVTYLEDAGQTVLYSIDATQLHENKQIKKLRGDGATGKGGQEAGWDVVLFNFPHVGGKSTDVNRQVRSNQDLLVRFFASAKQLLNQDRDGRRGTIVVTLFEGEPYTLWNVRDLARHSGLEVVRSFRFDAEVYSGYRHARTLGNLEGGGGWKGEEREARSYVFRKKEEKEGGRAAQGTGVKRKRGTGGESSDDEG